MGRRPNPQRKQDLLDEIIDYLGEHGIGDLSLRPLAKRLGTSTYTLTYQFGSKDQLLTDAVQHAQARQLGAVAEWSGDNADLTPGPLLRHLWAWIVEDENLRLVRMLLEATTLAHSQPEVFGDVGHKIVSHGVELLRDAFVRGGVTPSTALERATQVHATLIGLQVDLIATGDLDRVGRALDALCASLEQEIVPSTRS